MDNTAAQKKPAIDITRYYGATKEQFKRFTLKALNKLLEAVKATKPNPEIFNNQANLLTITICQAKISLLLKTICESDSNKLESIQELNDCLSNLLEICSNGQQPPDVELQVIQDALPPFDYSITKNLALKALVYSRVSSILYKNIMYEKSYIYANKCIEMYETIDQQYKGGFFPEAYQQILETRALLYRKSKMISEAILDYQKAIRLAPERTTEQRNFKDIEHNNLIINYLLPLEKLDLTPQLVEQLEDMTKRTRPEDRVISNAVTLFLYINYKWDKAYLEIVEREKLKYRTLINQNMAQSDMKLWPTLNLELSALKLTKYLKDELKTVTTDTPTHTQQEADDAMKALLAQAEEEEKAASQKAKKKNKHKKKKVSKAKFKIDSDEDERPTKDRPVVTPTPFIGQAAADHPASYQPPTDQGDDDDQWRMVGKAARDNKKATAAAVPASNPASELAVARAPSAAPASVPVSAAKKWSVMMRPSVQLAAQAAQPAAVPGAAAVPASNPAAEPAVARAPSAAAAAAVPAPAVKKWPVIMPPSARPAAQAAQPTAVSSAAAVPVPNPEAQLAAQAAQPTAVPSAAAVPVAPNPAAEPAVARAPSAATAATVPAPASVVPASGAKKWPVMMRPSVQPAAQAAQPAAVPSAAAVAAPNPAVQPAAQAAQPAAVPSAAAVAAPNPAVQPAAQTAQPAAVPSAAAVAAPNPAVQPAAQAAQPTSAPNPEARPAAQAAQPAAVDEAKWSSRFQNQAAHRTKIWRRRYPAAQPAAAPAAVTVPPHRAVQQPQNLGHQEVYRYYVHNGYYCINRYGDYYLTDENGNLFTQNKNGKLIRAGKSPFIQPVLPQQPVYPIPTVYNNPYAKNGWEAQLCAMERRIGRLENRCLDQEREKHVDLLNKRSTRHQRMGPQ